MVPSPPQIPLPKPTTSFELYERPTGADATPSTAPTEEPKQAPVSDTLLIRSVKRINPNQLSIKVHLFWKQLSLRASKDFSKIRMDMFTEIPPQPAGYFGAQIF
ncbi:hypothetical protein HanPI659440_Chr11g0421901 [Helianthus annuus]|nr:hypothetical protein HanOQP8_Chr11g0405401 [Helianthus annuus]KAJ0734598.1 hypothetical protein HanPI659440_Chr11g0421901 [Helianthus annuus]